MSPDDVDPGAGAAPPVDDLHHRFDAFRTVATPPPPPVEDLPPVRRATPRWLPAVAAAVVVLALLSLAVVTRGGESDQDLTTASPDSSTTTALATSTVPGTAPATTETTTSTDPTTTVASPTSQPTATVGPSTPTSTPTATPDGPAGPEDGGDAVDELPTTTEIPAVPPTTSGPAPIPPPGAVPAGAPIPPGRWAMQWSIGSADLHAATTTFEVNASYVRCSSWAVMRETDDVVVTETADAIVISISADPPTGNTIVNGCPDPPRPFTTRFTVTLSQPLGSRWVYDGSPERAPSPVLILDPNDRAA